MSSRHRIRIAALAVACLAGTALAGLSVAASGSPYASGAAAAASRHAGLLCVKYDSDDTPQCLPRGHRGPRGKQGQDGPIGPTGAVGPVGLTGPAGAVANRGPAGPQGIQGIQGIEGIQGPPGAFAPGGSDTGGSTVVVLGSKVGPIPFPTGPGTGTELPPSVARCQLSGPDREAYDGGAIVITSNPSQPGPTGDVAGLESSFPGLYVSQTEVDPLPIGGSPGTVSAEPANAYEAQAVISNMHSGDNVTVQAYVVCGP
jgi:hypothetical protein